MKRIPAPKNKTTPLKPATKAGRNPAKAGRKPAPKAGRNPARSGVFAQTPLPAFDAINASLSLDKRLWAEDIKGSLAHAEMLAEQKIISPKDASSIKRGLNLIEQEIKSGRFPWREALEDVHMNIEHRLMELIGEPARRLHTARSRNDQVATDMRLYVRAACGRQEAALKALQAALLQLADQHIETLFPGFTHLQIAQPISFAHHCLAYVEMLGRDRSRFSAAAERMNECPLGAGALAGTGFPIDRHTTAEALGFFAPTANSLDSVGSRDFLLDYLAAAAIHATHLSRLAEEIILWSSSGFGLVSLSERVTSGSSIMPQKRNPDAAELVRGKTGAIFASLLQMLTILKGLPLTYNKDLQDDKDALFRCEDQLQLCQNAMQAMLYEMHIHKERAAEMAGQGYSTATDLADYLVRQHQLPFRDAHHITGEIVRAAEQAGVMLQDLPLKTMQKYYAKLGAGVFAVLTPEASCHSRQSHGGTAPSRVREALQLARKKYS